MIQNKKIIIFDLDGVLIDSIPNMKFALKKTSLFFKVNLNFEKYRKYLGLPFEQIMKNMGIFEEIPQIKKKYIFFSNQNLKKIKIKKANYIILKRLRKKFKLAIFTSKDAKRTKKILSRYKLFDYVITSDDIKKGKPNPEGLKKILKFFKLKNKDAIFIGDSIYDHECASKAKIVYYHANWGYHKLKNSKKIIKINKLNQILKLI